MRDGLGLDSYLWPVKGNQGLHGLRAYRSFTLKTDEKLLLEFEESVDHSRKASNIRYRHAPVFPSCDHGRIAFHEPA